MQSRDWKAKRVSKNTVALTGQERTTGGGDPGKGGGRDQEERQEDAAVGSHHSVSPHRKQELAAAEAPLVRGRLVTLRGEWRSWACWMDLGRRRRRWRWDAGCRGRPHARHDVRGGGACKLKPGCLLLQLN
jgi:hypothetical protein